jgi:hypoxanthine phosphoribosyltransferase
VCTLLARESADLDGLGVRYVGFTIPGDFVIGYGLDAAERYRNLRYLAVYEPQD